MLPALPRDKHDTHRAEAIVAAGFPVVEPLLPTLFEWLRDINWPVARTLQPLLVSVGVAAAPHVRFILNSSDDVWKYFVLAHVVAESPELAIELRHELQRIASIPTHGELEEDVCLEARAILSRLRSS